MTESYESTIKRDRDEFKIALHASIAHKEAIDAKISELEADVGAFWS